MTVLSSPRIRAPRPRQRRNPEETKRRLLDAAEAEFAAKGYDGARLGAIAMASGAQQALIHHYFGDKEGLYRAVVARAVEALSAEGWDILGRLLPPANAVTPRDVDLRALVVAFVESLLRFFSSHARLLSIFRHEACAGGDFSRALVERSTKPVFDAVVRELESLRDEGQVRADVDPRHLCVSACAMCAFPFYDEAFVSTMWPIDVKSAEFLEGRRKDIVETILSRLCV